MDGRGHIFLGVAIKNLQKEFSKDVLHLNAKVNRLQQEKMDDEISVSCFPSEPEPKSATEELCKPLEIPTSMVYRCYSFEFNNRKTNWLLIVIPREIQAGGDTSMFQISSKKKFNFMLYP
jgi:hypothetical protein